jgi:DHA1 family multidrug resistance protein-like MFS transporter
MKSQPEIDQESMTANEVAYDALIKPWQINFLDPAVVGIPARRTTNKPDLNPQAFTTVYTALVYGISYSFFESFPLVYSTIYKFNAGESNLPFLSVVVSLAVCVPAYCAYFYYIIEPRVMKVGFGPPEGRLVPGLWATFCVPAGMFLFGT